MTDVNVTVEPQSADTSVDPTPEPVLAAVIDNAVDTALLQQDVVEIVEVQAAQEGSIEWLGSEVKRLSETVNELALRLATPVIEAELAAETAIAAAEVALAAEAGAISSETVLEPEATVEILEPTEALMMDTSTETDSLSTTSTEVRDESAGVVVVAVAEQAPPSNRAKRRYV